MKKFLCITICMLLVLAVFAGCARDDKKPDKVEVIELDIVVWAPDYPAEAEQIVKDFSAKYDNINATYMPMGEEGGTAFLQARIASDTLPDVFSANVTPFDKEIADEGYFLDIGDTDVWDAVLPGMQDAWTSPTGVRYGISGGIATTFTFINMDMLREVGVENAPTNFEELLAAGDKLKAAGKILLGLPGHHNPVGHQLIASAIAQGATFGVDNYPEKIMNGEITFNTPEMVRELNKFRTLIDGGYVQEGYMGTDQDGQVQLFLQEQVAVVVHGSWMVAHMLAGDAFDVAFQWPLWNDADKPSVPIFASETGWSISAKTKHPEAAIAYLRYLNLEEGYALYQNTRGNIPAIQMDKLTVDVILADQVLGLMDAVGEFETGSMAFVLFPGEVYAELTRNAQSFLAGDITAEELLDMLDIDLKAALEE